jgi:hypothetical protein
MPYVRPDNLCERDKTQKIIMIEGVSLRNTGITKLLLLELGNLMWAERKGGERECCVLSSDREG